MLRNYLKIALKVLLRRKFFTFISLFGIAFTLLVLMVVTAMLDELFAPKKPESQQRRTLGVYSATMYGPNSTMGGSAGYGLLDRYLRGLDGVERETLFSDSNVVESYIGGRKISSQMMRTDGEFWNILDFHFLEGAPYTTKDVEQAAFVAVINDVTRRRFFGDGEAIGRTLETDGQRFRVVGVVPAFGMRRVAADIWVPWSTSKSDVYKREQMGNAQALVLARDAASLPAIREQFNARLAKAELDDPRQFTTMVAPLETVFEAAARRSPVGDEKDPRPQGQRLMAALAAAALLFMLLPTVNLININVSRIMERASEIGVRKAFGASSRTLVGQFIVENIILTLVGGAIGLVLSWFVLRALNASGLLPYAAFGLNVRVFVYGLGFALLFGLLSGVYPAWRMSRLNPVQALKGATR